MLHDGIIRMVKEFHSNDVMPHGCNASFLSLIPKIQNPQHLSHFRPISLIGSYYKIIAKILSKRLSIVLPSLIDECQSAFIGQRSIMDSMLVANEVVEEVKAKRKYVLIFKADFEKTYDSVGWSFLYHVMQLMGFPQIWIN